MTTGDGDPPARPRSASAGATGYGTTAAEGDRGGLRQSCPSAWRPEKHPLLVPCGDEPAKAEPSEPESTEPTTAKLVVPKPPGNLLGLDLGGGGSRGLTVHGVAQSGAAARAGAERYVGWRLTHVAGNPVRTVGDVRRAGKGNPAPELVFERPPPAPSEEELLQMLRDWDESSGDDNEHPQIEPDPADGEASSEAPSGRRRSGRGRGSRRRSSRPPKPRRGDHVARRFAGNTTSLILPVSAAMIGVVYSVQVVGRAGGDEPTALPVTFGGGDSEGASTGDRLGTAALTAIIITALILGVTICFVLLYKFRCMTVILGWLLLSSALVLWGVGMVWVDQFCVRYQIAIDWITMVVLMTNFMVVGLLCIYYRGHPYMTRCYHVATSVVMAWFLTRLPEWTTWCLLAAVALYDLFAVFCGPLKVLVEESQARDEPIPALVYESRKYKLGLGDFIFYSVLVGRAAMYAYLPWVVCFVAILAGLCATLFGLGIMRQALPALPLSIFSGMIFYFLARYLLLPWAVAAAVGGAVAI